MHKQFLSILIAVCWLIVGAPSVSPAENPVPGEYELKAAFLYNFAKFVEWPAGSFADERSPFSICVLGDNPFGSAFDPILAKTVNGRPITVRVIDDVAASGGCHLLFVSASEQAHVDAVIGALGTRNVLTASDMKKFSQAGGMISFVTVENKIRFEINVRAASRARIKISSQLLKLARTVIE